MAIASGGPMASRIVSPIRQAPRLLIMTVFEGVITTPGPCGGMGKGGAHILISAPPAPAEIVALIAPASAVFSVSSASLAAGAPGVPAAASLGASGPFFLTSGPVFSALYKASP